jgi:oligopeptide transport system ATP-binding protein
VTAAPRPDEKPPAAGLGLLEIEELRKTFERRRPGWRRRGNPEHVRAVDGVTMSIAPTEVLGLVGESGSGKTTVGRCIAGLEQVTGGTIRLSGELISGRSPREFLPYRRGIQMVFQDSHGSLDPRKTVFDTVAEPLRLLTDAPQSEVDERVHEALADVGIDPDLTGRFRHQLSGGQAQRVNIARALGVRPRLVVLDEAVSALDASLQARVIAMLDAVRRSHSLSYLFISHDLHAVRAISDRVGVMYRGRLVELGETARIFTHPEHPYTRLLLSSSLVPSGDTARDEDERRALREQVRRLDHEGVAR